MKDIKVSILITTYNRLSLLKNALNSVLSQTYENIEIIISDDNSTDGTYNFCTNIVDNRIKYIINNSHLKGPNGNKNNAMENASGDYLCFLDDDDELYPEAISDCLVFLKDGCKCVFADCIAKKDGVISGEIWGKNPYEKSCFMDKIHYHCGYIKGEYFKLFSKEFIEDFRFDEDSFGGENELYIRFFESDVYYFKKPLYVYCIQRDDSATKNAYKYARKVAHAYIKTVNLSYDIAIKYEPKFLALQYKMAAYYAKIDKDYILMYKCLFKSLSIKITKEALVLLSISFLPNRYLHMLSKFRVKIKDRLGV